MQNIKASGSSQPEVSDFYRATICYDGHMEPTLDCIDSIYVEKVVRARRMTVENKLLAGPRLFAFACEASRAGIRLQNPHATPEQVDQMLRLRLETNRKLQEMPRGRS